MQNGFQSAKFLMQCNTSDNDPFKINYIGSGDLNKGSASTGQMWQ